MSEVEEPELAHRVARPMCEERLIVLRRLAVRWHEKWQANDMATVDCQAAACALTEALDHIDNLRDAAGLPSAHPEESERAP